MEFSPRFVFSHTNCSVYGKYLKVCSRHFKQSDYAFADPQKLLLPDPDSIPSYLSDKFIPIFSAFLGFGGVLAGRYSSKKPIFSGIQHHILSTVLGGALGYFALQKYNDYNSKKEAIYRHYISLHPEDFPKPERVKVGDVFTMWTPIR